MRVIGILLLFLCIMPACSVKQELATVPDHIALYIEMPENKLVFENVSALLYRSLWDHFDRAGYTLHKEQDAFRLNTCIEKIDASHKYLSPDLLTYAVRVRVDILCKLYDKKGILIKQKVFNFATLVSRSKDYVENSQITDFEYVRLFDRYVHKIDTYFKRYVLQ